MKKKLIIYGLGKFAEYIAYVFNQDSPYDVVAYCVEGSYLKVKKEISSDLPLINFDDIESKFSPEEYELFITVGNDIVRERIFLAAKSKGYKLASYVSSFASYMENLKYGENVFIGGGSGIQPFVEIEDNCILIGVRIGHHTKVCKNSLLSHPVIGSNVVIGQNSFLGINCSIKPDVKIGKRNVIGMGAVITKDTGDGEVYSPSPTKKRTITYDKMNNKHLQ
ncbi:acetyltransferase [Salinimicrobium sp. TH3]|uniref:acetyltransferase n=1 Tax=Salinimicrobium sp. TH3 TaxID=2997342 RepID=UPI002275C859|nr:acetyltransferase [Salinimicrobium sp. TH3]MCY2686978.1 acetyltransferase [Salinimicrobium sp. TH3]